jgi:predicted O-methyltransferase YrrM
MSYETWSGVEAYFEGQLIAADPVLEAALAASAAAGLPSIQVSASQGKLLHLLALTQGARRILEIGTLGGYSALWLARALPSDGHLVTLEREPRHAEIARQNFERAGLTKRIKLHVGPALDTLGRWRVPPMAAFDFFFIDADKPNNLAYVQAALALSRPGSLIVIDNVVRDGAVVARRGGAAAEELRRMTEWIARERRLTATAIQAVGAKGYDGFLLARVQAGT